MNFKLFLETEEKVLDELNINPTSTISKKFIRLVRAHFLPKEKKELEEAVFDDNKITKSDILMFMRYGLLEKIKDKVKLTMKGIACSIGMSLDTNKNFTIVDINNHISNMGKRKETPLIIGNSLTYTCDHTIAFDTWV